LVHQEFIAAAIEDILDRGKMPDWAPLIAAIEADPYGEVAERTLRLCDRSLYGPPVFRRVIAAARIPRPCPLHRKIWSKFTPKKRFIGYARFSTVGQTFDSQLEQLGRRDAARRDRYQVTGRTVPRYDIGLCRGRLRHPGRCGEAGAPPHLGAHRAPPGRRQARASRAGHK
jgi:hypothetical protein